MKKWYGGAVVASLFMLLLLRYGFMKNPVEESYLMNPFSFNGTNPLEWVRFTAPPALQNPGNASQVISFDIIALSLFAQRNLSKGEQQSLLTWNLLKNLINHSHALPNGIEAIKEAGSAWNSLMASVEEEKLGYVNDNSSRKAKEKQCPQFLNKMNATEPESHFKLRVPCGLTQGSSITIIGIPNGVLGDFRIDLTGEALPGEPDPPIILHYNIRLHGDKITEDSVIVQNTWTLAHDWGEEERCPPETSEKNNKVDELDQCNKFVGKDDNLTVRVRSHGSRKSSMGLLGIKSRRYFPFKQGSLFVATVRVGSEGIQMTVDGKHITSFAYRETLEPWLVSEVRISGDVKLISVLASGLPTSEDSDHTVDIEALKSVPLSLHRPVDLFIGVFSTANNFKRRMAVRRTWMQYPEVRSGMVVVRFFVGLHKNHIVNDELWNEARTYGDVQLMPFVDYYSLITWKTLAICTFGTQVVSGKFVMKTDDDAFIRLDEVMASLSRINVTHGLLYGLINSDSQPHRSTDSKWYISPEEWSEDRYPPWAHGPGYVVSNDIAKAVYKRFNEVRLKMFKLEDVAMGIWIADMIKVGLEVRSKRDDVFMAEAPGDKKSYVLWQFIRYAMVPSRFFDERKPTTTFHNQHFSGANFNSTGNGGGNRPAIAGSIDPPEEKSE
ncbi:Beta-1,3-galactosyltransferase 15 [Hibiscus syriacus]|uniref:Beta-1,3-galactosyltransferase 15 n=1 Tax=Hibiscus syriacus TaxID=106335 RepID=A0A6A3BGA3_HIBSY|nr:Beta-1,3-galactosyltransferase 15 [Hibiscus syriacus]